MSKENVNGDNFTILKTNSLQDGGQWNILEAGPMLILTLPADFPLDVLNEMMENYKNKWGTYIIKRTNRRCVAIKDTDVDKLESIIMGK